VTLEWETGTRSRTHARSMMIGPHRAARTFSWKVDEPRQLLGGNHGANPQELLFSAMGSCILVAFVMGATARGVQLETLEIEVDGQLDLRGFMGLANGEATGFSKLTYQIHVAADAGQDVLEEIHQQAIAHSPNAQTLLHGVTLAGSLKIDQDTQPVAVGEHA
ncbi:MAG: OsmC family protein, partial [Hyphomonadaceae bacterium]